MEVDDHQLYCYKVQGRGGPNHQYLKTLEELGSLKDMILNLFISYIFIDASGWVISDVSFGFMGGFGSCNIRPPRPNDPFGIDLTPTPIPAANLRIHTRQMTTEIALYPWVSLLILQQPIRTKLF